MERSLCLLILICFKIYGADFIYSAQISTLNHVTTYQNISISPIMLKNENAKEYFTCTLHVEKNSTKTLYEYLLKHKDRLFDCFASLDVKIYSDALFELDKINSSTQLFFMPIRFRAKYSKDGIRIFVLK